MADANQNTLVSESVPSDQGGPKLVSNGRRSSHDSVGSSSEVNSLRNLEAILVDELKKTDCPLKVVEEESALMAELKKPRLMPKKVVFHDVPVVKVVIEDDMDDDDEDEDCAMVIDEQDVEEDSKTSQDADMAEGIDHLDLKPVIVTDQTRKESFLSSLGLVTKETLSELQNKKYTRKRRSTANPHFSNAAIEAKRINQMELAAKKARRKEQMAELRSNKPARMSLYRRPEAHLKTLAPLDTNKDKGSSSLLSAKKLSKVVCDCFICSETCDTNLDVILHCSDCKSLFHATCAASLEEIISSGFVSCPKCGCKRTMDDEMSSNEEMQMKAAPKHAPKPKPSIMAASTSKVSNSGHKVKADGTIKEKKAKKLKTERTSIHSNPGLDTMASANRENVNCDEQKEGRKIHYEDKRKELETLIERKFRLETEWNERKKKLDSIRSTFKVIQERSNKLETTKNTVSNDIDKLVGFIKSVQIWQDIIDSDVGNKNEKQSPSMTITPFNSVPTPPPTPIANPVPMASVTVPLMTMTPTALGTAITIVPTPITPSAMTMTPIPPPITVPISSSTPLPSPVPMVVPMVVNANNQQIISSHAAPSINKANGQPVISATVSSIGNKVISINTSPSVIKAGPINVPQFPKVFPTTSVPVNSSNGTIEIMLQRVPTELSGFNPGMVSSVRNVTPGFITVPVTSLTGQKIIVPRIITNVGRTPDGSKTQVNMHRSRKPVHSPGGPYIPIMRATIPSNNVKTYAGVGAGSTIKCATPPPMQIKVEPQVNLSSNDIISASSSANDLPGTILESVVQSDVIVPNDEVTPTLELPDIIMEPVAQSEASGEVGVGEITVESMATHDLVEEVVSNNDVPCPSDEVQEVVIESTVRSEVDAAVEVPSITVEVATVSVEPGTPPVDDRTVKSERPRRSPRQRESKSFPGFTKFNERKGRART